MGARSGGRIPWTSPEAWQRRAWRSTRRVCPGPAAAPRPPLRDGRLRQGVQLLDRRDAPLGGGSSLGRREQEPGLGDAAGVHPAAGRYPGAPERRDRLCRDAAPGLHQLPERHGRRRRPGQRQRELHLQLDALPRQSDRGHPDDGDRLVHDAARGACRRTTGPAAREALGNAGLGRARRTAACSSSSRPGFSASPCSSSS